MAGLLAAVLAAREHLVAFLAAGPGSRVAAAGRRGGLAAVTSRGHHLKGIEFVTIVFDR